MKKRRSQAVRQETLNKQISLINEQRPQLLSEISSVQNQIESERKQVELIQQQVGRIRKTFRKGLGRSSALVELKIGLGSKEATCSDCKESYLDFVAT